MAATARASNRKALGPIEQDEFSHPRRCASRERYERPLNGPVRAAMLFVSYLLRRALETLARFGFGPDASGALCGSRARHSFAARDERRTRSLRRSCRRPPRRAGRHARRDTRRRTARAGSLHRNRYTRRSSPPVLRLAGKSSGTPACRRQTCAADRGCHSTHAGSVRAATGIRRSSRSARPCSATHRRRFRPRVRARASFPPSPQLSRR